jgi:polysaccharide export outer membrane protein
MNFLKTSLRTLNIAFRGLTIILAAVVWLALPSAAQFSGPALPQSSGSNRPTTLTTDPAILFPPSRDARLGSGDLITVRVFGPGEYSPTVRIGVDGKVQLPLIGVVSLDGLSVMQAELLIAEKLRTAGMFVDPQVTIQLVEGPSNSVSLVGEMHGVIPIVGQRRLLDVLAAGGGLPVTASHIVTIDRPGVDQPIIVDLGTDPARSSYANIPIFGGDTIVISRVGVVYVLGAFRLQGAIPVVQNTALTLMQVAALAGGPNYEGKYDDMRIIRTVGNQRTFVKVDIKKVMYGRAPDPVLQADDIIFLPQSNMKAIIKSGGIGTVFGIVSVLIALRN